MPYLTTDTYVDTFGEIETRRLTSENGTTIDLDKVQNAINAATAFADGYIGSKYALPLASTPPALVPVIADLARERLHPAAKPKIVEDNANLARTWLRDVAAGRVALPVASGGTAPVERQGSVVLTSRDARPSVYTDEALAGFGLSGY